jgi:hypothetical protein
MRRPDYQMIRHARSRSILADLNDWAQFEVAAAIYIILLGVGFLVMTVIASLLQSMSDD